MEKEQAISWLQRLKDESWEAELLVSVASIFAIMNAFSLLDWVVDFFINNLQPEQYFIGYMISFVGYLGFGILGSFFVIHFSLRAYWIGLVGLNSVFPDYSVKDSVYSEIYTKKMSDLLPKVPTTINTLDEVCSVIFSASFALLMIYLYLGFLSALLLTIYSFASTYVSSTILFVTGAVLVTVILMSLIGSIVANIKRYKQNVKIQTWFFHSVVWSCKVFYGPFYKLLLQTIMTFASNYKKKPAIAKTLLFMVSLGFGLATAQILQSNVFYLLRSHVPQDESRIYPELYLQNNVGKTFLLAPEIQSQIVSEKALSLFVPLLESEVTRMEESCKLNGRQMKNLDDKMRQKKWRENLDCYATSINLLMNDQPINSEFIKIDHAVTGQFGLFAFVSLHNIEQGAHRLTIMKKINENDGKKWQIPFYFSAN